MDPADKSRIWKHSIRCARLRICWNNDRIATLVPLARARLKVEGKKAAAFPLSSFAKQFASLWHLLKAAAPEPERRSAWRTASVYGHCKDRLYIYAGGLIAMHCIMLQEYPVVRRLIELPRCRPFMPGKAEPVEAL